MTFEGGCYCGKIRYRRKANRGSKRNVIAASASISAAACRTCSCSCHRKAFVTHEANRAAWRSDLENPVSSPQRNPSRRMVTGARFAADGLIYS